MTKAEVKLEPSWKIHLQGEFEKPYMKKLKAFLLKEKQSKKIVYPEGKNIAAFDKTPFDNVKVVIMGQDPYHGPGQAHGLCFSVQEGVPPPPSLKNIYKEIHSDLNLPIPKTGCLEKWADQGVLLLNSVLTVRAQQAASHHGQGWEEFTDRVIEVLNEKKSGLVFLLWGSPAQKKGAKIDRKKHFVLTSVHPSPLSAHRGFMGCKHFSQTNELLKKMKKSPIDWTL